MATPWARRTASQSCDKATRSDVFAYSFTANKRKGIRTQHRARNEKSKMGNYNSFSINGQTPRTMGAGIQQMEQWPKLTLRFRQTIRRISSVWDPCNVSKISTYQGIQNATKMPSENFFSSKTPRARDSKLSQSINPKNRIFSRPNAAKNSLIIST